MSICGVTTAASAAMLTAAMRLAAPASVSGDNPCWATLVPVCALVPVLPGLDHDVDLTRGPDPDAVTPNDAEFPASPIGGP